MVYKFLVFTILASFCALQQSNAWELEEGVVVLNNNNFDTAVVEFHQLLVEFHAPWCPHCQKLQPEFALAAKELTGHGITLAKVDCTKEIHLAKRFGIEGYPTLRIFDKTVEFPYHGHRTHSEIVSYMLKNQDYIKLTTQNFLMGNLKLVKNFEQSRARKNGQNRKQKQIKVRE